MNQLRTAIVQINPTVGDLAGNAELIVDRTRSAAEHGAHAVVVSEMALTGYPVEDLALRSAFVEAAQEAVAGLAVRLDEIGCGGVLVCVGCLDADESGARNSVAAIYGGRIVARQAKHHLPNYGVFDERRNFAAGQDLAVIRLHGVDIGMVICEDLWQAAGPVDALAQCGVDLILAPNASPYERAKDDLRRPLAAARAREAGAALVYCNQVGGQDDLVFDGNSFIVDAHGTLLARSPQFEEHLLVSDLHVSTKGARAAGRYAGFNVDHTVVSEEPRAYQPRAAPPMAQPLSDEAEVWSALVLGLRDYVRKNGFTSVVLGFSGGIDSSVSAALAVDALGPAAVHGVSMPSRYSSQHSRSDAAELSRRLGCRFTTEPIDDIVRLYVEQLSLSGLAEENVQARVRGVLLMALSNSHGHLVLAPGNKTEIAVGYSTLYGDSVGAFAPIKDVFKTHVWNLAQWRNDEADNRGETRPIPERAIRKPPSAELRPGQLDSDTLPDYTVLDSILDGYVEGDREFADLRASGFAPETIDRVVRMVDTAEYKRRQYPPGTKITFKAFGKDRRLPMTNAWREVH